MLDSRNSVQLAKSSKSPQKVRWKIWPNQAKKLKRRKTKTVEDRECKCRKHNIAAA